MSRLGAWFKRLPTTSKITTIVVASILSFGTFGTMTQQGSPSSSSTAPVSNVSTQPQKPQPKIETKTVTKDEPIAYISSTINDPNLAQGTVQTQTAGVNGVRTFTYEVTLTDNRETARKEISNVITTQPITEVIAHGTKAPQPTCPNGTYVNSAGNTVCRPYEAPSAPTGATAQCGDGTYSYSQSRRGTCSHHGGVARWL